MGLPSASHIIIFKEWEIIFRNVPELWEGAISKAPEIIINHLNETLIRSCVHYSTQEGSKAHPDFFLMMASDNYHSSCHLILLSG